MPATTKRALVAATVIGALGLGLAAVLPRAEATAPTLVYSIGTVRPASVGGAWATIANAQHAPQNLGAVTCPPNGNLTIALGAPLTQVVGSAVMTDETWSREGIIAGASVGLTDVTVYFTRLTPAGPVAVPCGAMDATGNLWVQIEGLP